MCDMDVIVRGMRCGGDSEGCVVQRWQSGMCGVEVMVRNV
jgi:hypothetical protein